MIVAVHKPHADSDLTATKLKSKLQKFCKINGYHCIRF